MRCQILSRLYYEDAYVSGSRYRCFRLELVQTVISCLQRYLVVALALKALHSQIMTVSETRYYLLTIRTQQRL